MSVKLLTEHNLKFLSLKEAAQAHLSLYLSKVNVVGNHMSWLNYLNAWHSIAPDKNGIHVVIFFSFFCVTNMLMPRCFQ